MKLYPIALALAVALPAAAQAQVMPSTFPVAAGNSLLTIAAQGQATREPDLAVFNAGVTSQGQTAAAALAANAEAMTKVIAALRRAGIAERDIQTNNLSINPIYADPQREAVMTSRVSGQPYVPPPPELMTPRIVAYQANNMVTVRHHDVRGFGPVIDALAAAGANQINGPMLQLDDDEAAQREARADALKKADERAAFYAQQTGQRVVRKLSISEGGNGFAVPMPMYERGMAAMASSSPVAPGSLQLGMVLTVVYEMAPR